MLLFALNLPGCGAVVALPAGRVIEKPMMLEPKPKLGVLSLPSRRETRFWIENISLVQAAAYNVAPRNQNSLRDDYESMRIQPVFSSFYR